jgi:16S rRNA (uracil1498-N3)-methyltransferase
LGFPVRIFEVHDLLSKDNRHRLERVMRLRPGDAFVVTDGKGSEAEAILQKNGEYTLSEWYSPMREPELQVTLFAPPIKGERFEWLVEKSVELGVRKIVPVFCRNSVLKKLSENKLDRWRKIAISAMLQSGGCILTKIENPVEIEKIPAPNKDQTAFLMYEKKTLTTKTCFTTNKPDAEVLLLTGPEGGFADDEIHYLEARGWQSVWLGNRILRAETAPIVALANIFYSKI